jgi:hypothetical protein
VPDASAARIRWRVDLATPAQIESAVEPGGSVRRITWIEGWASSAIANPASPIARS